MAFDLDDEELKATIELNGVGSISEEKIIKRVKEQIDKPCVNDNWTAIEVVILQGLLDLYNQEKEKNKKAYIQANNYLYFDDSSDYGVALWEVIRSLRPDLAERWDNGEIADLKYIKEDSYRDNEGTLHKHLIKNIFELNLISY